MNHKKYKTILDVKNKLKELNSNFVILEDDAKELHDIRDKALCKCTICNKTSYKNLHSILQGYGCKYCYSNKQKIREFLSVDEMKQKIKNITNGEYELISDTNKTRDIGTFIHHSENCLNKTKQFQMKIHGFITLNHRCPFCNRTAKGKRDTNGVKKIKEYLNKKNIAFIQEMSFDDCRSDKNRLLFFDIYVKQYNLLIEFDGVQHTKSVAYFGGDTAFEKTVEHDSIKNNYAKKHNINLIRINKINKIEEILNKYFEERSTVIENNLDNKL